MNEDWRYHPERLEERRFCLGALVHHKVPIDRRAYDFCHYYTSSGACTGLMERYTQFEPGVFDQVKDAYDSYCYEQGLTSPESELSPMKGVDKVG